MIDAEAYRARALQILDGDVLGDAVYYLDPLYPFFLAGVYALVSPDGIGVLLAQAALDACSVVIVMLIAQRVFDARTALAAGCLASTYSIFFYYDALLLKAPLMIFLMVMALFLITRAADHERPIEWLPAGFFLGLAALTRGNLLLFAPALALWLLAKGRGDFGKRFVCTVVLTVGVCSAILPVTARNYFIGDDLVLLNSQAGQNFYIGHFEGNNSGVYQAPSFLRPNPVFEESDFASEARRRSGVDMKPSEISNFWMKEGLGAIAADPGRFLRHSARKILVLLNGYEIPDNASFEYFRQEVGGLIALPFPGYAFILPLSVAGLLMSWRRPLAVVLGLFVVTYSAGIVLFFNLSRLRLPIVPALIVLAAFALVQMTRGIQLREWTSLVAPVIALAVLVPVTRLELTNQSLNVRYVNMGVGFLTKSEGLWSEAAGLREQGEEGAAMPLIEASFENRAYADAQFIRALEITPDYHRALRALRTSRVTQAILLEHLDRIPEFMAAARGLVQAYPNFVGSYVLLGKAEVKSGRANAARRAFSRALELQPNHAESRRHLEALAPPDQAGPG